MNYTPLYGNNLCNLLSNKIIEEFNKISLNHKTSIIVVDLQNFLVVKGKTTIKNPINYSKIFSEYLSELSDINKSFNVIDLVEYNVNLKNNTLCLSLDFNLSEMKYDIYDLSKDLQGFYKINYKNETVSSNNKKILDYLTSYPEFSNFTPLDKEISSVFMSHPSYGKNLMSEKILEIYFKYITFNLFEKQLMKDITYNFYYKGNIKDISWDNINLRINSHSSIVELSWLHSLILDVFDFNPNSIKKHLSLDDYNFENEIISDDKCWKLNDKLKELILL